MLLDYKSTQISEIILYIELIVIKGLIIPSYKNIFLNLVTSRNIGENLLIFRNLIFFLVDRILL